MKFKLFSTAALTTVMVLGGLAAPAQAAPNSLESNGTITYEEDTTVNPPIDPENPDKEVDPENPIVVNPDGGSLTVDAVTNLDFGAQKAVTTDQDYFAKQVTVKENGTNKGTRGNWVQVTDKRLENRTPWKLTAKMTQQFTAGTKTLGGATLTYTNPFINSAVEDTTTWPTLGANASTFTLSESGNSIDVIGTENADKGFGTFTVEFGSSAGVNGAEDTTGTPNGTNANLIEKGSVSLYVPGSAIKTKAAYTGKVLWTISETP
ncbi:WxL domain-containing protein [Enterococcus wangshanyuanii]|uniref:Cell surface protein n=1 Tax=Enterococcus wangshanyuanii TaxID=2005703 RepID=A0ABQ1PSJ1_9ENTE|nr:WxL domain-containing protein [Enterococcus wangshanyuanii]GGD02937.1 cell surface protein [Enterococcus wangshanyuanii]